jgi:hypothetical protein
MTINFDDFKVRCSAISKVLSNSQSNPQITEKQTEVLAKYRKKLDEGGKITENQQLEMAALIEKEANGTKIILSDTCIDYLMIDYAWVTQGMIPIDKESLDLVGMKKGKMMEGESVTLLTRLDKVLYKVHKERIYNTYLSGEIDVYLGAHVYAAENVTDIKNATDYPTFLKKIHTGLEKSHDCQVKGYMDITNSPTGTIAHTLVDCPYDIIEEYRWKLTRKLGAATPESPEVLAEWPKWEKSMKFSHIPMAQRVHKINIEPMSIFDREKLYDRVKVCREWLNNFHESYQKLNLQ